MPEQHCDILISGGGIVGAALAAALSQTGLNVHLLEQRSLAQIQSPDPVQRASFIVEGCIRFLHQIGAWPENFGTPVKRMRIWDADRFGSIGFDAEEAGVTQLGVIAENRKLEQALHGFLAGQSKVTLHYQQHAVQPVASDGAVQCEIHGNIWRSRLLAVAEGRDSLLRQALNIQTQTVDYQQKGIIATVSVERPHQGTASYN